MLKQNDWWKGVSAGEEDPTKNLHETSTCTSGGSGNNAKHSHGKLGNFIYEIEWEPCVAISAFLSVFLLHCVMQSTSWLPFCTFDRMLDIKEH